MAAETQLTIIGNLTANPELRFTSNGTAVANFTVASTPRFYDRQAGEWRDGDAMFLRCTLWRYAAENLMESLNKGDRVLAHGRLRQRSFETTDGEKRSVMELEVDDIGASVRYATAKVSKVKRQNETPATPAADDPPH